MDIQKQFFEQAPLIFVLTEAIYDAAGLPADYKALECNPAFNLILGLDPEDVMGKGISEWLFETKMARRNWLKALRDLSLSGGRKEFIELLLFRGDYYRVTAFVPGERLLGLLLHKAEEYQEMRASLDESQAFTQSMFDNTPFAVIIYEVQGAGASSMDYIIRSINPACQRIEGWNKEDVIGKPLKEVRPGVDDFGVVDLFYQVFITGESARYPAKIYSEGQEDRWYENTVFKLPSGEIVAVYDDITKRIKAEEELYTEKERLRVTLYSIGDAVMATDKSGEIQVINEIAQVLTGWEHNDAIGKPLSQVFDIFNETTGEPCENPVDKVLRTGNIINLANHTVLRAKHGLEIPIADSAAPIKNQDGDVLGVVLVFRDITETRAKEAKIEYLSYKDVLTGLYCLSRPKSS